MHILIHKPLVNEACAWHRTHMALVLTKITFTFAFAIALFRLCRRVCVCECVFVPLNYLNCFSATAVHFGFIHWFFQFIHTKTHRTTDDFSWKLVYRLHHIAPLESLFYFPLLLACLFFCCFLSFSKKNGQPYRFDANTFMRHDRHDSQSLWQCLLRLLAVCVLCTSARVCVWRVNESPESSSGIAFISKITWKPDRQILWFHCWMTAWDIGKTFSQTLRF